VKLKPLNKKTAVHKGGFLAHCTYLGAAVLEGHGIYSIAAGVLLFTVIAGVLVGVGHEA
jgi:hypothetical protein